MSESSERVAILFTGITACFSYEGYRYNKEKFRLELFEKRWDVASSVIKFLKFVSEYGHFDWGRIQADDVDAFAYIERHEMRCVVEKKEKFISEGEFLFDRELVEKITLVRMLYSNLIDENSKYYKENTSSNPKSEAENLLNNMNKLFAPYLYFGDYKSPQPTSQINLCDLRVLCSEKISLTIAQIKKFITCSKI